MVFCNVQCASQLTVAGLEKALSSITMRCTPGFPVARQCQFNSPTDWIRWLKFSSPHIVWIFVTKSEWHWDHFYKEMKISDFSPICHFQSGAFFLKLQMSQDGRLWKDCDSKELRLACNLADTFPWAGDVKTAVVYEVEPGGGVARLARGCCRSTISTASSKVVAPSNAQRFVDVSFLQSTKYGLDGLHFRFWYFIKFWNSLQSWHISYILIQFV